MINLNRPNFKDWEFWQSDIAKASGIDNRPKEVATLYNLNIVADKMQEIRNLLGTPIKINSGYRCKQLNLAVGGDEKSYHMAGLACDFVSPNFGTPKQIAKFLRDKYFICDKLLMEGSWCHIQFKSCEKDNRRQFATYLINPKTGKREFKFI